MEMPEIKASRAMKGLTQNELAERMEMKVGTYRKKASGGAQFTDREKVLLSELLGWTFEEMNDRLYNGVLPLP